jgi:hypothetical protein
MQSPKSNCDQSQIDRVVNHIRQAVGRLTPLSQEETFEYSSLALCVLDAVFSMGARYESTWRTVEDFCRWADWETNLAKAPREYSVGEFIKLLESSTPEQVAARICNNRQRTSPCNGILKTDAVLRFVHVLQRFGIHTYADLAGMPDDAAVQAAVRAIPGQPSGICFSYFLMLAGNKEGVKADRMVLRFIGDALGTPIIETGAATVLVRSAASRLQNEYPWLTARLLDQLIWNYQRTVPVNAGKSKMASALCRHRFG